KDASRETGEAAERGGTEAGKPPGFLHAGAQAAVKLDRPCIPVEDVPSDLIALFLHCDACQSGHQRLARAFSALVRQHEEVFDEKDGAACERGIDEVIKREADRSPRLRADQGFKVAVPAKAMAAKSLRIGAILGEQALVSRETTDERQHHGRVPSGAGADAQRRFLLSALEGSY